MLSSSTLWNFKNLFCDLLNWYQSCLYSIWRHFSCEISKYSNKCKIFWNIWNNCYEICTCHTCTSLSCKQSDKHIVLYRHPRYDSKSDPNKERRTSIVGNFSLSSKICIYIVCSSGLRRYRCTLELSVLSQRVNLHDVWLTDDEATLSVAIWSSNCWT